MSRALLVLAAAVVVSISSTGCNKAPEEPLKLEGNMLTVSNVSDDEWTHVEIWLNRNFRMITPSIPPGKRFQASLDTFVTGEGPHWTYTTAEDLGVNVLYGGHYATETFGVKALAARLSRQFKVPWTFLDHPTGL